MDYLIEIILGVVLIILVAFYMYKQKKDAKFAATNSSNTGKEELQRLYEIRKQDPLAKLLKDKIELSWKFLYDITEIILYKFSQQDRDQVHDLGRKLFKLGMRYEHVIDLGINYQQLRHTQKLQEEREKAGSKEKQIGK